MRYSAKCHNLYLTAINKEEYKPCIFVFVLPLKDWLLEIIICLLRVFSVIAFSIAYCFIELLNNRFVWGNGSIIQIGFDLVNGPLIGPYHPE